MTKMPHSKGPWTMKYEVNSDSFRLEQADEDYHNLYQEMLGNALLAQNAPEMLEALEEASSIFRWYGDLHQQKYPPDTDKAIRNYDMAEKLDKVIYNATHASRRD